MYTRADTVLQNYTTFLMCIICSLPSIFFVPYLSNIDGNIIITSMSFFFTSSSLALIIFFLNIAWIARKMPERRAQEEILTANNNRFHDDFTGGLPNDSLNELTNTVTW